MKSTSGFPAGWGAGARDGNLMGRISTDTLFIQYLKGKVANKTCGYPLHFDQFLSDSISA